MVLLTKMVEGGDLTIRASFQYLTPEDPWRNMIPKDTDVLVTHTPPVSSHLSI